MQDANGSDLPKVGHYCVVFADFSFVQEWQWHLPTIELVTMAYSKVKQTLNGHLDTLKTPYEATSACE